MESVSVLISCYNGKDYIQEQVNSILSQKDVVIKIFIRDDGSPDFKTKTILERLKGNPAITIYYGSNIGYARSFMELVKLVPKVTDYYAFCDQDDVWMDNKLSLALSHLREKKEFAVYSARPVYVDKELNISEKFHSYLDALPYGTMTAKQALVAHLFGLGCTMVWNKTAHKLLSTGDYKNLTCGHDNLVSVLAPLTGSYYRDDNKVFYYRQHGKNYGANKTKKNLIKKIKSAWHGFDNPRNYELRKLLYEQFCEYMSPDKKVMLFYSIDYRCNMLSKLKLLSLNLSSGMSWNIKLKYHIKVLFNKY